MFFEAPRCFARSSRSKRWSLRELQELSSDPSVEPDNVDTRERDSVLLSSSEAEETEVSALCGANSLWNMDSFPVSLSVVSTDAVETLSLLDLTIVSLVLLHYDNFVVEASPIMMNLNAS